MKRLAVILLLACLGGCDESAPPRAVPVSEDGALRLRLCTFNVRYEGGDDEDWREWPRRIDRVVGAVREIDADVLGVQEAFHGQVADLWASLPDHDFHGVGRRDGEREGEYAGIFWKRHRFERRDAGTFWLSDRPDEPGSRTWGNSVVRCVTWVRLRDLASDRTFLVYNTHWDHRHQGSRERSARLMAERIDQRARPGEPVVLLGDFNATENNPAVAYLRGEKVTLAGEEAGPWAREFIDPYELTHPEVEDRRTLHFWSGRRDGRAKVDHVLVSGDPEVIGAGIVRASTRRAQPSDHYPVWAEVVWGDSKFE